ncbi:hypothetical protein KAFR_0B01780 [Kazachstania africana CBS 2517]|uniref:Coatomer subunit zeta n=1 Tax=Kazachstania africana (strain ATCC 22294 / BCRC 22015 / CBS 2517 / CECT 1963 / NBRC 1671 / NRRL Y-8276) TaxID=1071382 RepID=H2AQ27_KAZAF|nr:hypothetical protein KAFR_0B01780 [Kazachstania africana CBS 2517]CCF56477.1 hypothetical protein KAFR_0B01780 [Kazachstania africana CBS 2517]
MSNLSLYSVNAILILDNHGNRIYSKYYKPPHLNNVITDSLFDNIKKQKEFEQKLFKKTHKQDSEILIFENNIILYKEYIDVTIYLVGNINENEIILQNAFSGFKGSMELLLNNGIDNKNVSENCDLVYLLIDEIIDNGVILETDPASIASRVTKQPTSDTLNQTLDLDKGLLGAWGFAKSKLQERLQQGL